MHVLDYIQKDKGTPIEIRVNYKLKKNVWTIDYKTPYEFIIICPQRYNGYKVIGGEPSGNPIQSKTIKPDDNKPLEFYLARNELGKLAKS
jgi:hypothetical protein